MKLIDTHCHFYSKQFGADTGEALDRARAVCDAVFLPNIDTESVQGMLRLCDENPDFFFPMMGLHPCSVDADYPAVTDSMEKEFALRKYYGVGETGLDYYWDKTRITEQKESLRIHIRWAKEMDLPLILHCRESMDDVIELVQEGQDGRLRGIFHCFSGTDLQAARVTGLGFLLGIGGTVTYARSPLPEVLKKMSLSNIVLETDSPYLPPVPYRGKRNEPAYIRLVADKLAEVFSVSTEDVAAVTSSNARTLFRI